MLNNLVIGYAAFSLFTKMSLCRISKKSSNAEIYQTTRRGTLSEDNFIGTKEQNPVVYGRKLSPKQEHIVTKIMDSWTIIAL